MTFVLLYTVMLAMRGFSVSAAAADRSGELCVCAATEVGVRAVQLRAAR